jgi:hypothetical protein
MKVGKTLTQYQTLPKDRCEPLLSCGKFGQRSARLGFQWTLVVHFLLETQ